MILHPKKTKFRKAFKGRIHGKAKGGFKIAFGKFALKALEPERIQEKQIESARKAINRHLRRAGKLWIRIFPDIPVSKKPADVRMGKGKGSLKYWCFPVKSGRLLFEFQGVSITLALEINKLVNSKLSLTTKLVKFL
jgi:large subunit ribosomal protein L16